MRWGESVTATLPKVGLEGASRNRAACVRRSVVAQRWRRHEDEMGNRNRVRRNGRKRAGAVAGALEGARHRGSDGVVGWTDQKLVAATAERSCGGGRKVRQECAGSNLGC